jgi:hypothetical protein
MSKTTSVFKSGRKLISSARLRVEQNCSTVSSPGLLSSNPPRVFCSGSQRFRTRVLAHRLAELRKSLHDFYCMEALRALLAHLFCDDIQDLGRKQVGGRAPLPSGAVEIQECLRLHRLKSEKLADLLFQR